MFESFIGHVRRTFSIAAIIDTADRRLQTIA